MKKKLVLPKNHGFILPKHGGHIYFHGQTMNHWRNTAIKYKCALNELRKWFANSKKQKLLEPDFDTLLEGVKTGHITLRGIWKLHIRLVINAVDSIIK